MKLTGRTRHRLRHSFSGSPLLILQVEVCTGERVRMYNEGGRVESEDIPSQQYFKDATFEDWQELQEMRGLNEKVLDKFN